MTAQIQEQADRRRAIASRRTLMLAAMLAAFVGVGAIAIWDSARESEAALMRMAGRHRLLAFVLSKDMSSRLALMEATTPAHEPTEGGTRERYLAQLLEEARELQHQSGLLLLVRRPDRLGFLSADGRLLPSQPLEEALQRGAESVILHREEAVRLGLPRRIAVAGLGRVADRDGLVPLSIAVVSTAQPERERSLREEWRSAVSLALLALVVFTFGGATLREQQREFELTAQLEREQVERERDAQLDRAERLATVAALSTGIAHELATPLGVITGRVEQLVAQLGQLGSAGPAGQEGPVSPQGGDPRMLRAVHVIGEQVARMRSVMHGFLALARGESPRMEQVFPAALGRDAEELVRHRFAKRGARLVVQTAEALPPIACDASLFTQVLVNLLVNACQASRPGDEVRLVIDRASTVRQTPGPPPDPAADLVRFAVYDEGEGIASDIAHRVTQPFFTTRGATGGTGLGLAIASELVQHHQGQLVIEPRARREGSGQRGTVAEVYIPVAKEEADARRQARP